MNNDNNRNLIVFTVIAVAVLMAYQVLFLAPAEKRRAAAQQAAAAAEASTTKAGPLAGLPTGAAPTNLTRNQAMAATPRLAIDTPTLKGSLSLVGGRIDDLFLKTFSTTVDPASPPVELLRPQGADLSYFATFGWVGQNIAGLPDATTTWTPADPAATLSPGHPVALHYDNGAGVVFERTISIDANYMFTIDDVVTNSSAAALTLAPYASVQRQGLPVPPAGRRVVSAFEGVIGALGETGQETKITTHQVKYADLKKKGPQAFHSKGGWAGITDKYWLAAVIPDQADMINANYKVTSVGATDIYEANFTTDAKTLAPGASLKHTDRFFAGAKQVPILKAYEKSLAIPRLDDAVDWGLWFPITRPVFWLLDTFFHMVGNFGVAILMLTVVMKAVFFYPSNLSFAMSSKMRKIQPELEALKTKYKDDPAKQQQGTLELYKREKINPLLGCLPMLATIPVFFSLFKVLNVTIEMRHAPFFGWVHDLSAPDPLTIMNLFGLIPWDPST
ncbi:MAG: rane protein insertase YidC, partial [Caulobacteraceae bacterium]|nr:rane protein insertase YidC [Caulobacteraceae bacterium]